ncbi:alpha/beta hydrolase [Actinacidiphila bryophytorum]|uniref:Thermostable monoacylglycerol lipase n=1 Tax=Actinacidiphila bryophytorum TaxID=1436133 RepID=A0A9W4E4V4_9ACTN|nr:alpha/beta fold hydrolase [Actinacidiphila bryophytorum]MBM9436293.1 alpha/beta fold hydrolase [Actinacidiphila bryophytorum]MBN6543570.1 alpha/beta fold hydrolase [Actinacidiphila bryophytorum]CAG7632072.1 Thermostable monoacylglycerol lipase [Actinacidiphila bryophytorum]
MPLMPGAEPYRHDGGEIGVLLCHGFTGSPQSMRPWGEYLAERGLTVSLPLLPGHGTRWQDMQVTGWQDWYAEVDRALRELTDSCSQVFVCGLSMGGTLALRLAARHGAQISGLVLVNPSVKADSPALKAVGVLRHAVPSVKGIASDIAKEGGAEIGYDRTPLHAVHSLTKLWQVARAGLPQVTQPILLLHSRVDHVVHPSNSAVVLGSVSSTDVTEKVLERSFHVATLDNDAERIFEESYAFVRRLSAGAGLAGDAVKEGTAGG